MECRLLLQEVQHLQAGVQKTALIYRMPLRLVFIAMFTITGHNTRRSEWPCLDAPVAVLSIQANKKRRSSSVRRPRASASRPTVPSKTSSFFSCKAP